MKSKQSPKRNALVKNIFSILQIKKMIGKKMMILHSCINLTNVEKNNAKLLKSKIFDEGKHLIISATCREGILYVFKGVELFLAIQSIPYREIDEEKKNTNIIILQYENIPRHKLLSMISC